MTTITPTTPHVTTEKAYYECPVGTPEHKAINDYNEARKQWNVDCSNVIEKYAGEVNQFAAGRSGIAAITLKDDSVTKLPGFKRVIYQGQRAFVPDKRTKLGKEIAEKFNIPCPDNDSFTQSICGSYGLSSLINDDGSHYLLNMGYAVGGGRFFLVVPSGAVFERPWAPSKECIPISAEKWAAMFP